MEVILDGYFNNYNCNCVIVGSVQKQETSKALISLTKAYLIKNGYYDLWVKVQKAKYYYDKNLLDVDESKRLKYEKYLNYDLGLNSFQLKCCRQIFNSRRARVSRLKKRLEYVITNYDCIWLTLTFTDEVFLNTSKLTRRRYIARFLKSLNVPFYVAKIDFGDREKNPNSKEREHYHAVIQSSKINFALYPYGIINGSKIRNNVNSVAKLSQYINKISYHFFKDSTKHNSLIYSRNNS